MSEAALGAPRVRGRLAALARTLALLAAAYALMVGLMWWGQEWLLFRPERLPADHRFALPRNVQETWIAVDGGRLNALHLRQPQPTGFALILHGNGGHLGAWWFDLLPYTRAGLDVLMIDYRGYGKSPGRIESQAQLEADVRAAWDHAAALVPQGVRVLVGRSLGAGLAARLAAEVQPDTTLLVAPYTSVLQLAVEHHPWVPTPLMRRLLRYPLAADEALARIRGPVTLLHGEQDTLIPVHHARRLHALAPGARLVVVPQAAHGDLHRYPAYQDAVTQALREVVQGLPAGAAASQSSASK
jgi:alpha-beta hydrolase superfamily lysophospholipase